VKTAVAQTEPSSVTDLIPNITTSTGALAKDQIEKVMDQHPNVKEATEKVIHTLPKVADEVSSKE
jgi:hypothetical protein